MNFDATTEVGPRVREQRESTISSFMTTAMLEFEASLQLLAERARFLTAAAGAAIAVGEGGHLVYVAASGVSVPDTGTAVDPNRVAMRTLLAGATANWVEPGFGFGLVVPVLREQAVVGLVELVGQFPFEDREQKAVLRLAEMVNVALEHRDAAFEVEHGMTQKSDVLDSHGSDHRSHATGGISAAALTGIEAVSAVSVSKPKVQTCGSCGFPVSDRRTLCVDCEQNSSLVPPVELFSSEPEQSWLSTHGYAIASIVVSALAALIIFWVRR